MSHWGIPLVLLIFAVSFIVSGGLWARTYTYPHLDNERTCNSRSKWPESCKNDLQCCTIWNDKDEICRKGRVENGKYVSKGHVGPLILVSIGLVLFVAFIFTMITALT